MTQLAKFVRLRFALGQSPRSRTLQEKVNLQPSSQLLTTNRITGPTLLLRIPHHLRPNVHGLPQPGISQHPPPPPTLHLKNEPRSLPLPLYPLLPRHLASTHPPSYHTLRSPSQRKTPRPIRRPHLLALTHTLQTQLSLRRLHRLRSTAVHGRDVLGPVYGRWAGERRLGEDGGGDVCVGA